MDTAQAHIDVAPLPSARELRRRSNVLVQLVRFLQLNVKMYLLAKRHHWGSPRANREAARSGGGTGPLRLLVRLGLGPIAAGLDAAPQGLH